MKVVKVVCAKCGEPYQRSGSVRDGENDEGRLFTPECECRAGVRVTVDKVQVYVGDWER